MLIQEIESEEKRFTQWIIKKEIRVRENRERWEERSNPVRLIERGGGEEWRARKKERWKIHCNSITMLDKFFLDSIALKSIIRIGPN